MSMFDRLDRYRGVSLVLALGWTSVGCGATGLDWVDQPESAAAWSGSERSVTNAPVPPGSRAPVPAMADNEPAAPNHQRLNHTVTLGELDVPPPGAEGAAPYGPGGMS